MRAAAIILLMATGCAAARELRQMPPWVTAGGGGDAPSGVMPPWATAAAPGAAPGAVNGSCPPPGFDAVDNLDVESYISAPWYVLSQVPLIYQPKDQLFCTQARYEALGPDVVKDGIRVLNFARTGAVDGPSSSTASAFAGASLLATVPDPATPSKLEVGFDLPGASNLPGTRFGAGPYWVVALGEGANSTSYDWAIVSSGPPSVAGEGGCRYAEPMASGLWLFSRNPDNPEAEAEMMALLEEWGVDTSILLPVEHEGCTYEG